MQFQLQNVVLILVVLIAIVSLSLWFTREKKNHFDINKMVAVAHIKAEQLKGLFLATAKLLLVLLSGLMLFFGILLAATDIHLAQGITWSQALYALPVAIVGGLFAIAIEGGTLFSASFVKEHERKVSQGVEALAKVKGRYTEEEYQERVKAIKKGRWIPFSLMATCILFSVSGAEIFWQKLLETQGLFFHLIGGLLGIVVSALLIFFEFNEDLIQRVIENCISSSALIMLALDQSAKSQIHNELFNARSRKLKTAEFSNAIANAAEQGLYGVLNESLEMAGVTVTAEQLQRLVEDKREARAAGDAYLESVKNGNTEPLPIQTRSPLKLHAGRMTAERKRVINLKKRYGTARILQDPAHYAQEANVSEKTLKRWLGSEEAVV